MRELSQKGIHLSFDVSIGHSLSIPILIPYCSTADLRSVACSGGPRRRRVTKWPRHGIAGWFPRKCNQSFVSDFFFIDCEKRSRWLSVFY